MKFAPKKNEKHVHHYKCEKTKKSQKAKTTKFSPYQKSIIESIYAHKTEDKKYVSTSKIIEYIRNYYETNGKNISLRTIKSQLTRMENNEIIIKKKNSYSLLITDETIENLFKKEKK